MTEPTTPTGKRLAKAWSGNNPSADLRVISAVDEVVAIEHEAREQVMGDDYRTSVENIVENAAAAERERCIAALQQEGQNALDSGIRPSEPELSAWNYVGKHFRDNAAAILADPEAPSDDEVEPPSDEVWKHLPVSRFEAPSDD